MRRAITWTLTAVAAGMFLFAGSLKLIGAPMMVELFTTIGIGQWFRYLTGLLEVGGAIALFVPAFAPLAAVVLAVVMVGAILTHLFIVGGSPLVPIVLLAITIAIAYLQRQQISSRLAIA